MSDMFFLLLLLVWVVCGVLAFGVTYGNFQGHIPELAWAKRRADAGIATAFALGGPFGLFVATLLSGFWQYGLRYRPMPRAESWTAFHKRWPTLPVEEFER